MEVKGSSEGRVFILSWSANASDVERKKRNEGREKDTSECVVESVFEEREDDISEKHRILTGSAPVGFLCVRAWRGGKRGGARAKVPPLPSRVFEIGLCPGIIKPESHTLPPPHTGHTTDLTCPRSLLRARGKRHGWLASAGMIWLVVGQFRSS